MNDIRVKIVESPRNPSGDLPAPPAVDGNHHNEVDPLAFDVTDLKGSAVPTIKQEKLDLDEEKNHRDDPAKERNDDANEALEHAKVLDAQCEKIKGK